MARRALARFQDTLARCSLSDPALHCCKLIRMETEGAKPSRRGMLKKGIAAAAGGAAIAAQSGVLLAQSRNAAPGRKFRGWISRGTGPGRTTLQELTLRPISGRQVLVRTEATNLCYTNATDVLGLPPMN